MFNSNLETVNVNQYIFNHKKQFNIEIGSKIKEIRNKKNISTEQMAIRTMMTPSYIMQIENGTNGVTLNKFVIIITGIERNPKQNSLNRSATSRGRFLSQFKESLPNFFE